MSKRPNVTQLRQDLEKFALEMAERHEWRRSEEIERGVKGIVQGFLVKHSLLEEENDQTF